MAAITFTEIVDSAFPDVQFEINLRGGVDLPNMQELKDIWVVAERVAAGTSAAKAVTCGLNPAVTNAWPPPWLPPATTKCVLSH